MNICGHAEIREQLHRIALHPTIPQSYLFAGPRQLGKFLVALEFARTLVGTEARAADQEILVLGREQGRVDRDASDMMQHSVATIRRAEQFLTRFPGTGHRRVVIIDDAEWLTLAAENALLKQLEEPNSTAVIILVTHLPGKLLPTVRSRLFTFTFAPVSPKELRAYYPETSLPDFFFDLGVPGIIARAVQDPEAFEQQKAWLRELFQISRLSWTQRIALAEQLSNQPTHLPALLDVWIIGLVRQQRTHAFARAGLPAFFDVALETVDQINRREGNPRLLLEKLFTKV